MTQLHTAWNAAKIPSEVSEMVPIKTKLANKTNYGGTRSLSAIKFLVIHYTANDGDTDENNGNYFANNRNLGASAHYFVDDDSITQSVPDDYIAWHCGANSYKHPTCRNSNSIGIETCDDVRNGVIYPSKETIQNVIDLAKYLMEKYNIPAKNVIRHYDVTGKICPEYWVDDAKWKSEFWNKLSGSQSGETAKKETAPAKTESSGTASTGSRYSVQAGAFSAKKGAVSKCDELNAIGFKAFIVQIGAYWKVHVGPFDTKADAELMVRKLKAAGFSSLVVKAASPAAAETISVGSVVKVRKGAKTYDGTTLAAFVYNREHDVKQISGNRVVITYNGIVVAAIHRDDLILV